ncbi:hypothetical protein EC900091_4099, partial [Escherichia coli 90.0091]
IPSKTHPSDFYSSQKHQFQA